MKFTQIFKTKNNTSYLYSAKYNEILFLHPLLKSIINKKRDKSIINIETNDIHKFNEKEIKQQIKKYNFLLKNGFFDEDSNSDKYTHIIKGKEVESQIANLRQLTFEITDACNLKCEYCGYGKFYEDYDSRKNKFLNIKAAKNLIDYLVDLWNSNLNTSHEQIIYISFYGGEPLLNMRFIKELISYINKKKLNHNIIRFSLTTNCILLDKNIDFLVKHNFNLLLSLDGNQFNNSYRVNTKGENSFDLIVKNIKFLKDKYPDFFENNVNFNSVLHNRNSVEEVYSFMKNEYNKVPMIGELNNMGIKPSMKKSFDKTFNSFNESLYKSKKFDTIEKEMFMKIPTIESFGIFTSKYTNYFYKYFSDFYLYNNPKEITPSGTCFPFSKKMYVTVNGKILACERIGHQFSLGKINEETIELNYNEIAEKYNMYFSKMRNQCNKCYMQKTCTKCIYNIATIDDKDTICERFTDINGFIQYLSFEMSFFERKPEYYSMIMKKVTVE